MELCRARTVYNVADHKVKRSMTGVIKQIELGAEESVRFSYGAYCRASSPNLHDECPGMGKFDRNMM